MVGGAGSSRLSRYDRGDEQNKNLQSRELVYDYERGEIIDPETGEVVDQIFDVPSVRASDYGEWQRKIHHAPMKRFMDRWDREIYSLVQSVGTEIGAPRWLREEVYHFLRRIREKKAFLKAFLPSRRAGAIKLHDWKFVLATYYVLSKNRGLYDLAESIGNMKCEDDVPCYGSKKLKDEQFFRYMVTLEDVYRILYQESFDYRREVEEAIRRICEKLRLPPTILEKALEKAEKLINDLRGAHPRNIAAASVLIAIYVLYGPDEMRRIKKRMIKELGLAESSIRTVRQRVPIEHFEVVYCIFYRLVPASVQ